MRTAILPPVPRSQLPQLGRSYLRSLLSGRPLPPGALDDVGYLERSRRNEILDRARALGPIFKGIFENQLTIFVVDSALGRRILKEHARSMRPVAINVKSLFPNGHMRQMDGEVHRHYRRLLVQAVTAYDFDDNAPAFHAAICSTLDIARRETDAHGYCESWSQYLSQLATELLIRVFFGAERGDGNFAALVEGFHRLGPHGVIWNITNHQRHAFNLIRSRLIQMIGSPPQHRDSLLQRLKALGETDETMLGNLIYMVELGRYDLRGLLRWVSKYAAEFPLWLDRISQDCRAGDPWRGSACEAFILEVLRLEQSERLMRTVEEDFSFEGYLVPKGSLLRVCLWEIHKSAAVFRQPFQFDPARFMRVKDAQDGFSPFGLDHHHCPLALLSIRLAMAFLAELSSSFRISSRGGNPPVRGPYHWEPAPDFIIGLESKDVRT